MRFLPLYLVVVTTAWALHNYNAATADWLDLAEHLTLTQSLDSERIFYTLGPAWTLSVEWFFYLSMSLLAPAFVRWIRRGGAPGRRMARFLAPTLAILIASLAYKWMVAEVLEVPVTEWAWRFGPAAKADIFIVGMYFGTAIMLLGGRKLPAVGLPILTTIAVASYWLVKVPPSADHNLHHEVSRHTVAAFAFGLLLFAISTSRWQAPARLIDNALLLPMSMLAYSIYILHEPVLHWVEGIGWFTYTGTASGFAFNAVLVLTLTVPVAWFFHRTIEMPWAETAWLLERDGRQRELYPDLVAPRTPALGQLRSVPEATPAVLLVRRLVGSDR